MTVVTQASRARTWRIAVAPAGFAALLCIFYADAFVLGATGWKVVVFPALAIPALVGLVIAARTCRAQLSFDSLDPSLSLAAAAASLVLLRTADLTPVLAIGIVGVVAGLAQMHPRVVGDRSGCLYAGSFAGACSPLVFPGAGWVLAAGALTGLLWMLLKGVLPVIGGRLGATAFCAVFLVWIVATAGGWDGPGVSPTQLDGLDRALIIAAALVAALLTHGLAAAGPMNPVLASALPTVVVTLLAVTLDGPAGIEGAAIASAWLTGSFVGMTGREWTVRRGLLPLAGLLTGLYVIGFEPELGGLGGDLGTTACIAVLASLGLLEHLRRLRATPRPS